MDYNNIENALVFSHALVVFATESFGAFALLAGSINDAWAREYSGSLETRLRFTPSDCFETLPFPQDLSPLESVSEIYHNLRRDVMTARREGLTATYNRFHSPHEVSHDISTLRALHAEMDHAVAAAYCWTDLDLGHGFHQTKQGIRYTISEAARSKVLDRLLAKNHELYAAEQAIKVSTPKPKAKARKYASEQADLF